MASDPYSHLYLAKLERISVNGELVETRLTVLHGDSHVSPESGDHYVTLKTKVELFEEEAH